MSILFGYARQKVPQLAEELNIKQEPFYASPGGQDFVLGLVTPEIASAIPLSNKKIIVVPSHFTQNGPMYDAIKLSTQLATLIKTILIYCISTKIIHLNSSIVESLDNIHIHNLR